MDDFRIVNVVASTRLDKQIDVEKLSFRLKGVEYTPEIWPGLVWRRENPKATIIMFASGKVTSVGTKSENEAITAIKQAIQAIPELADSHYNKPKIVNIVAVAQIDNPETLDLELISIELQSIYEPHQFPGLIFKDEAVTFLVFPSGKISLVGGKSEKQVKEEMRKLISKINLIMARN